MRRIMCVEYSRCLMEAARGNRKEFDCEGCGRYEAMKEPLEEETRKPREGKESVMETKKVCVNCGEEKDLSEFHKSKASRLGVKNICKLCCSEYSKEYKEKKKTGTVQRRKAAGPKQKPVPIDGQPPRERCVDSKTYYVGTDGQLKRAVDLLVECGCLSEEKLEAALTLVEK